MTHNARALVLHHIFVWSLLGTFSLSYGTESEKHEWVFEISFKCGFEVGFLVFAISYTAFFMYYFNIWVCLKKRKKMMPTRRAVLVESRKNKIKEFDQLTQLRTKALLRERNIKVLSQIKMKFFITSFF
jgi:hypothetical protein